MRERLIELLKKEQEARCKYTREKIQEMLQGNLRECLKTGFEFSADYLLENGVIVPPCKVGTTIYMIVTKRAKVTREYFRFIKKTKLTFLNLERVLENWGKTVFLTEEEAISKLQASCEQVKEGAE